MCLLQLFETTASAFPDALAVACNGRQVTYSELNLTAERIAQELREAGVAGGSLVGVFLERSPEMVAGLLGIWKAGAAYVPLDPTAPRERITFMLEDSAPPVVLTSKNLRAALPDIPVRLVDVDEHRATRSPADKPLAAGKIYPDSVAYVVYTSGSTGKPKGVRISHGALANTIHGVGQDLTLRTDDVVFAWSTIAFDVSCLEIYLPLAFGASLYLVAEDLVHSGGSRIEQLRRSEATILFGTPTMYRLLLEEGWQGDTRMQLIAGGEVLPLPLARSLARMCRVLWNQYGPTETAICATRTRVEADVEKITIGHPLPQVSIYLLDRRLQPVPRGAVGEIYIGGAGVGLGYLHRPDLSRACFLPDPFADGVLMYKTGDLALQLADGRFDFQGRVDGQVKIRGFRIELGEIEIVLGQCEGVEAAVVRAIELEAGDRRLVAFVVCSGLEGLTSRWKQFLGRQLPAYMVPSEWISLPYFPTTPSGKVDVQALDKMRLDVATLPSAPEASPRDPIEARLKAIWERLLKVKTAGIHDDFFTLGGHSLLAARMLVQIEAQFGCRLPHSVLVEHPTIRGLATYLRESPGEKWPALVTLQAGAHLPPLFIAHGIGGSVLSFVELAAELGPEQPVFGLQLPASVHDAQQANPSILAGNYLRQIRAIQPSGPYHLAGHSSGGLVVFEIACQLSEQGETVGLLALLDCDPNVGKWSRHPFRDWASLKASFQRARSEWKPREYGAKALLKRTYDYERIKIRTWLAARAHRSGNTYSNFAGVEGYFALALRDYELRTYHGDVTLFAARDEPGSNGEPADAWAGKIPGRCETVLLPGNHGTILHRPQVTSLAREITQRMPKTEEAGRAVVASGWAQG